MSPVVEVENLKKHFPLQRGLLARTHAMVKAVDGVSFAINPGETLCLVGKSGCGKSTVGKVLLRLLEPTEGTIRLDGEDITHLGKGEMRPHRKRMQMVFQDPYASLNPRMPAGRIVSEPLENYSDISAKDRETRTAELFEKVGLRTDAMKRFPFEFSGGQRQRLGIARALALNPALIIADEPVSALDVSVQAQVLNLMMDLQEELGLAYLFVSHDLGVVEHIGHRVAVMYLGRIVEIAQKEALFETPLHPYTQALMAAAPIADPRVKRERIVLQGDVPSPINPPPGCTFHTRCPFAFERCKVETPALKPAADGRARLACHLVGVRIHPPHPHDRLDLDRDADRQRAHADRGACVTTAITEHIDEQIGAAVDHLRLVAEARHRIDHAEDFEHLDLLKAAACGSVRRRQQIEADELCILVGLLDGHILADRAGDVLAVLVARPLPRQIDRVAVALPRHVVRDRRRNVRQRQSKLLQVLFGAHAAFSSFLNLVASFGCHHLPLSTTPSDRMRLSPVRCSPVTST